MKSLLTMKDFSWKEIEKLIDLAADVKKTPSKYSAKLQGKTLLMIFEKPSLRTRLSFDVGMMELGGFTITIDTASTPLGEKESIEDTAKVCSRYVDCIMARLFEHEKLVKLSKNSSVPVINGLTNDHHPVQILSDLLTIKEKKRKLKGLKLCFLGDGNNNITNSLIIGCNLAGMKISVGCPKDEKPRKELLGDFSAYVTHDATEAIKDADIVYTDSWMSYHVEPSKKKERIEKFMPYQVNSGLIKHAKKDFIFMNCLPAMRGYEQTAEIIDGKHSVVFDQVENRLHMQKAILLELLQ